jgi:CHAD domain-containing protein
MARARAIPEVDSDASGADGIRLILSLRVDEMCALRDQALDWNDPEGVHDMRVASRRLRGALRDFLPYLRKRPLFTCLGEIRTIARALGRVRDYDVAIMALEKIAANAPAEVAQGILQFAALRRAGLEEGRVKLIQALTPEALADLKSNFPKSLDAALLPAQRRKTSRTPAATPSHTYRDVARSAILRRLEEFEELSKSFYRPLRVKPLHDLRIAAKHLRYALELFEQVWQQESASALRFVARKVAALQSSLGGLHDCDIWIEDFGDAASYDVPGFDFDRWATSVWLLSHFVKLHGKHLSKALTQWNEWQTEDLSEKLRDNLRSQSLAASSGPTPRMTFSE